jgi:sugar lactone lactonase YvrE
MYARPPKILTNVLYVSDSKLNVIDVFEADFGKRFPMYGQLSMPSRPEGITTDSADNLYVTVRGSVLVYPPATYVSVHGVQTITFPSSPSLVLTDPNDPVDVAIGPDGSVYVANQGGTNSPAGGSVSVFAPGATTAMYTIPFGAATFVDGVVLDAQNNLYVTWRDASGNAYVNTSPAPVAPAERTVGTVTVETTNDVFHGVAFSERYGSIVYADSLAPAIVSVPQYRNDIPFDRLGVPDYIGFDKYKTHLYVADRRKNQVEVYNYPTGVIRALINGNHLGSTAGVAVLPAAIL